MENSILNADDNTREVCSKSIRDFRNKWDTYHYVYVHKNAETNNIFYVGCGSHDRAIRKSGRSKKWYEYFNNNKIVIEIIQSDLMLDQALKLEKSLISNIGLEKLINYDYGHDPRDSNRVFCLDKQGKVLKIYDSADDAELDGFSAATIRSACSKLRKTYKDYIWFYEKDYSENQNNIFVRGKTSKRKVKRIANNGDIKIYESISETAIDGHKPGNVAQVCSGTKKSHQDYKFEYIE